MLFGWRGALGHCRRGGGASGGFSAELLSVPAKAESSGTDSVVWARDGWSLARDHG